MRVLVDEFAHNDIAVGPSTGKAAIRRHWNAYGGAPVSPTYKVSQAPIASGEEAQNPLTHSSCDGQGARSNILASAHDWRLWAYDNKA